MNKVEQAMLMQIAGLRKAVEVNEAREFAGSGDVLDVDIKDALEAAANPNSANPFVTTNRLPINVMDHGAAGNGTTDDTVAIQAAITAAEVAGGTVYLPPGTYLTTDSLTISANNVILAGAGSVNSGLRFNPTSSKPAIVINNGGTLIYRVYLRDFSIATTNTTTKQGIRIIDGEDVVVERIAIGLSSAGHDCIGLQLRGRQTQAFHDLTISAEIPISIEVNPNNSIDIDHYSFHNMYLVGYATQPMVLIASNVDLTNVIFDGYQAWAISKHGIYWIDTQTTQAAFGLVVKNVRWEQMTDATGYFMYISHNYSFSNILVENFYGGLTANGFYFHNCHYASLKNTYYIGTGTGLAVDSTNDNFIFTNPFWQTGTTFSLSGFVSFRYEVPDDTVGIGVFPPNARVRSFALSDSAAAKFPSAASNGGGAGGIAIIYDSSTWSAIIALMAGNNTVYEISDAGNVYSPTKDNAGTTNIYWSAANDRYEIQNKRGVEITYWIYLFVSL